MKKSLLKKLKKGNKTWKKAQKRAKEEGFSGDEFEDGRYKTRLTVCEVTESQSSGNEMVAFAYKILKGEEKGKKLRMYQLINDEDGQMYLSRILSKFGIALPDDLTELPKLCEALADASPEVRIQLKTKDGNQYTYVDRLLSELDLEGFDSSEDEDDDDDDDDSDNNDSDDSDEEGDDDDDSEDDNEDDDDDDSDSDDDNDGDDDDDDSDGDGEDDDDDGDDGDDNSDDDEDEVDIDIGTLVSFEGKKGKILDGKIIKLLPKEDKVKVKVGKKTYTKALEDLSLTEAETEDKPKKKKKKKVTKKPIKKEKAKKKKKKKKK